jgi:prophage tail gpP-like protein
MIRTNLIITLDEDVVSGDTSVISLKTTDSGNIIVECGIPKVALKLEDLEEAVKELRKFFITQKHIDVVANDSQVIDPNQLTFEYGVAE